MAPKKNQPNPEAAGKADPYEPLYLEKLAAGLSPEHARQVTDAQKAEDATKQTQPAE